MRIKRIYPNIVSYYILKYFPEKKERKKEIDAQFEKKKRRYHYLILLRCLLLHQIYISKGKY